MKLQINLCNPLYGFYIWIIRCSVGFDLHFKTKQMGLQLENEWFISTAENYFVLLECI